MRIPLAKPDIGPEEITAVADTMRSGWVTQGKKVEEFEKSFAKYCGVKHGVASNTGTAALHLTLAALDIKKGDEIITTPLSCVATTNPILYLNAKPVFADVEPKTLNINPKLIESKITTKTKAILPVHLFGHPVDLDPLMDIAEKHNIHVIEDAAQAHGAKYKDKKVGSIGHVSCFSFYADKGITTIEGGMTITNDSRLADKMRLLRTFGMEKTKKFVHPVLGYNYKMPDINAAIGLVQLRKLDKYVQQRRANIKRLKEQIRNRNLQMPSEQSYAFNVYYVCHIQANKGRDKIVEHLEKNGIETRPLLSIIPQQSPYSQFNYKQSDYSVAKSAHKRGFYISNSPQLTETELDYMASKLNKSLREN